MAQFILETDYSSPNLYQETIYPSETIYLLQADELGV